MLYIIHHVIPCEIILNFLVLGNQRTYTNNRRDQSKTLSPSQKVIRGNCRSYMDKCNFLQLYLSCPKPNIIHIVVQAVNIYLLCLKSKHYTQMPQMSSTVLSLNCHKHEKIEGCHCVFANILMNFVTFQNLRRGRCRSMKQQRVVQIHKIQIHQVSLSIHHLLAADCYI